MPPAPVPVAAIESDVAARSSAAGPAGPGSGAFAAWFAGSRIVADGAPLICYHGTAADFSVFVAHAPMIVYRLDGAPIDRVDSWDVDGDWSRRPEAFHYGALTDAVQLGAEAALAMREREAHAMATYRRAQGEATPAANDPADDTVRRLTDLRRLLGRTLVQTTEVRPSGDGHYFTPDPSYSFIRDIGQRDAGRVMPVYLAIRNPVYLNAAQIESAGSAHWVAHYRALGHDGAIFSDHADLRRRGWNGATQIVAFDAHQIKSVFNVGTYDPANPDIRFRRDGAQPLPAPAVGTPTPVAPNPFTLPPGIGSEALARHGIARSAAQREAAFTAWFKDSHVRHADGTPRICYHGTSADFTAFRAQRGTAADPGWYGSGIYLTADPATASAYAGEVRGEGEGTAPDAPAPRVIAAYVSLQRPYIWPAGRAAATTPEQAGAIRAELEAAGYDGVVVPNPYAEPELAEHWEVVAFHAAQVKSAYNVGTFDPARDDIRFARGGPQVAPQGVPQPVPAEGAGARPATAVRPPRKEGALRDANDATAAFKAWFADSKIVTPEGLPKVAYHGTAADFSVFDPDQRGRMTGADDARLGFFFAENPMAASQFTWQDGTQSGSIMPVHLQMRHPYYSDHILNGATGTQAGRIIRAARDAGHDGVVFRHSDMLGHTGESYVVFESAQVKSVFNTGTYDGTDPDIRFARDRTRALPAQRQLLAKAGRKADNDCCEP